MTLHPKIWGSRPPIPQVDAYVCNIYSTASKMSISQAACNFNSRVTLVCAKASPQNENPVLSRSLFTQILSPSFKLVRADTSALSTDWSGDRSAVQSCICYRECV